MKTKIKWKRGSYTCGKPHSDDNDESSTFSGFRSQWTIFLRWRSLRATKICNERIESSLFRLRIRAVRLLTLQLKKRPQEIYLTTNLELSILKLTPIYFENEMCYGIYFQKDKKNLVSWSWKHVAATAMEVAVNLKTTIRTWALRRTKLEDCGFV